MMVAHIGDSRLYRMRGDEFVQVTKDHSLLQKQIDAGMLTKEQAKHSSNKNLRHGRWVLILGGAGDPRIRHPARRHLFAVLGRLSDMASDDDIGMAPEALGANLELARNNWCRWRMTTEGATTCRSS